MIDLGNKFSNVTLNPCEKRRGRVIQTNLLAHEIDWLLSSPPLLTTKAHPQILEHGLDQARSPQLAKKALDNSTTFEQMLIQRRSTRLGIRYETLWQFLYQQTHNYKILASNLPVRDTKRTLGEFDLLYQNTSQPITSLYPSGNGYQVLFGKPQQHR